MGEAAIHEVGAEHFDSVIRVRGIVQSTTEVHGKTRFRLNDRSYHRAGT